MLYYFFGLAAAAAVLLISDHRSTVNRAAAFFLLCASIGGLEDVARQLPWSAAAGLVQLMNVIITPYGVLLFAIYYYGIARLGRLAGVKFQYWLLVPPLLNVFHSICYREMVIDYRIVIWWAAPYYLGSCWLLLLAVYKEHNRVRRRNRLITAVIMVPTLLAVLSLIYIGRAISPDFPFFRYIAFFFGYSIGAGMIGSFLYGVLGVKLRMERDPLETAMQSAASGTSLLNHTIKNEAGKIALSTLNLRHTIDTGSKESSEHLQIIEQASAHMLQMVSRIHNQMKDIVLQENPCRLDELIESCVIGERPQLAERGIQLNLNLELRPVIACDAVHVKAVIDNLLHNAGEAVADGGSITVRLHAARQHIVLIVSDNGRGIPAHELGRVFEPFYTTKRNAANFGLGLSYVYKVMRQSGGKAEIASEVNRGTTVSLYIPRRKLVTDDRRKGTAESY